MSTLTKFGSQCKQPMLKHTNFRIIDLVSQGHVGSKTNKIHSTAISGSNKPEQSKKLHIICTCSTFETQTMLFNIGSSN